MNEKNTLSIILISILVTFIFSSCTSATPTQVKDCRKNCISLYGECIESCKSQQPLRDGAAQKKDQYDYHNRVMMSTCASRCDNMKKKCLGDCDSYRLFENNRVPEK